jgi:hypothetical protein
MGHGREKGERGMRLRLPAGSKGSGVLHESQTLEDSVGDSHKGPLNNQGRPTYLRKKQTQTNLSTHVR